MDADIEALLVRAAHGDEEARQALLARHRDRLRQMVALRLDRRLIPRVDASDVVQEALFEAARHLDGYLRRPPLPFYPWLRQFVWDRLIDLHRRHVRAARRSVTREARDPPKLPDESTAFLIERLLDTGSTPSRNLLRDELRNRVQAALAAMPPRDREVLVLRYLEGLSMGEVAAVLDISEGAAKVRHMRALMRLRGLLDEGVQGEL